MKIKGNGLEMKRKLCLVRGHGRVIYWNEKSNKKKNVGKYFLFF